MIIEIAQKTCDKPRRGDIILSLSTLLRELPWSLRRVANGNIPDLL